MILAQELEDRAVEAQACYSLGNTYTLLRDYNTAVDYHLRHLDIAQKLHDRIGEGKALLTMCKNKKKNKYPILVITHILNWKLLESLGCIT